MEAEIQVINMYPGLVVYSPPTSGWTKVAERTYKHELTGTVIKKEFTTHGAVHPDRIEEAFNIAINKHLASRHRSK